MKIISQEEHWKLDKATNAFDCVEFKNTVFADIPFNPHNVQHKSINNELEFIMLPYLDEELQKAMAA